MVLAKILRNTCPSTWKIIKDEIENNQEVEDELSRFIVLREKADNIRLNEKGNTCSVNVDVNLDNVYIENNNLVIEGTNGALEKVINKYISTARVIKDLNNEIN